MWQKQHWEVACKKSWFHKFQKETPVLKSLYNKVTGPQACNFIKMRLQYRCFPLKICKIFKNTYFYGTSANDCFWRDKATASLIKIKFNFLPCTSIKFYKLVENYVISLLGLGPATSEITGKFIETVKRKNCKFHVK